MPRDFGKPVPIRLAYRYPNGSVVSYAARAVSYDGAYLRLIVNEGFEEGISLAVMAPFLEGLTTGRVSAASRSKNQPGYYEVVLRFGKGNGSVLAGASERQEQAEGLQEPVGPGQLDRAEKTLGRKQPARIVPEAIAQAAEELASALYRLPAPRFSQALQWIPAKSRPLALLTAVAAMVHLLEEKGLVNSTHLFRTVKGAHKR